MKTRLEDNHKILLEKLFNEYCILLYKRTFPLTDQNLFNYFLDFYEWKFRGDERILNTYFVIPILEITENDFSISKIICISNNKLWMENLLRNYNEYLNNELKQEI